MCFCPEEMDHNSVHMAANTTTAVLKLTAESFSNSTMISSTIVQAASTIGPHFARQIMKKYNNMTVADKVPPEMLHLVGEHWYD